VSRPDTLKVVNRGSVYNRYLLIAD